MIWLNDAIGIMTKFLIIRNLTLRYGAVLFILAALMVSGYVTFRFATTGQESTAAVINISGRQRMLSQRIAMGIHHFIHTDTASETANLRDNLWADISLMERSHKGLIDGDKGMGLPGNISPELRAMYFNPPFEIDRKVRTFLADIKSIVEAGGRITFDDPRVKRIMATASGELIEALNAAVNRYQLESEHRIEHLDSIIEIGLIIALFVLVFSAIAVFRPMTLRVAENMEKSSNAEKRFRAILHGTVDGIITIDRHGIIKSFNRAAAEIFGYTAKDVIGRNVKMLMPEPYRSSHNQYLSRYLYTGKGAALGKGREVLGLNKDGSTLPIRIAISETYIEGDVVFIGIVHDLSEQKEAEKALRESETRYQKIVELSPDAVVIQCDEKIVYANPAAAHLFGAESVHEIIGLRIADKVHEQYRETIEACCEGIKQGRKQAPSVDIKMRCLNGQDLDVSVLSNATVFGGKPAIQSVLRNITERKQHELWIETHQDDLEREVAERTRELSREVKERRRTENAFRESQERLMAIAGSLFEGVLVTDINGHIIFANRSAEKLIGVRDANKLAGHDLDDCFTLKEGEREILFADSPFRRVAETGETYWDNNAVFHPIEGHAFDAAFACSPLIENGKTSGTIISFRDIRELKEAQNEALQASKLASVGQLAAGIAHEINTPTQYIGDNLRFLSEAHEDIATIIKAYRNLAEAAKKESLLKDYVAKAAAAAEEADIEYLLEEIPAATRQSIGGVDQVARIVLAMKEFSHPGSKDKLATDLNHSIKNTLTVCRNEWKHIAELKMDLDPDLPLVNCLIGELNQVFLNLVVNASHAIKETGGEGLGFISISTRKDGDWVEIRIKDTGRGIPEDVREHIFDPFFTTKDVGKGTGQGLSICLDVVVNKHGGKLFFETEQGNGTTFIVRLPIDGRRQSSEAA